MIWEKSSLSWLTHPRLDQMVKVYYNKYIAILRIPKSRQDSEKYLRIMKKNFGQIPTNCLTYVPVNSNRFQPIESCTWEKSRKVSLKEHECLVDQRGERLMMLADVDKLESRKAIRRQITTAKTISPEPSTSLSTNININDIYSNDNDDVSIDSDYKCMQTRRTNQS